MHRTSKVFRRRVFYISLAIGLLLTISAQAWGKPEGSRGKKGIPQDRRLGHDMGHQFRTIVEQRDDAVLTARNRRNKRPPSNEGSVQRNWKNYQNLSPDEKARIKRNYQEWKSLPPERQRALRRKMEQWRELPPDNRALYEQIFRQWQKLSPEERQRTRENLEKWNTLSPGEKDQIRRRFHVK